MNPYQILGVAIDCTRGGQGSLSHPGLSCSPGSRGRYEDVYPDRRAYEQVLAELERERVPDAEKTDPVVDRTRPIPTPRPPLQAARSQLGARLCLARRTPPPYSSPSTPRSQLEARPDPARRSAIRRGNDKRSRRRRRVEILPHHFPTYFSQLRARRLDVALRVDLCDRHVDSIDDDRLPGPYACLDGSNPGPANRAT